MAFQIAFINVTSRLRKQSLVTLTLQIVTQRQAQERYRAVDEGHIEQELTHVPASGERVVVRRTFMRAA